MAIVVAVSGPVASGKSTLAQRLAERWEGTVVSTREEIGRLADESGTLLRDRGSFQEYGDALDRETHGQWVVEAAMRASVQPHRLLIIDAVRIQDQVVALRKEFGRALVHVHLATTDRGVLAERYRARQVDASPITELASYEEVLRNPTEAQVGELADHADVVLDTVRNTVDDLLVRCEARLGLLPPLTDPLVDVIVGGQYGSEGKGNVAYYLAPEYDVLVRAGGPNAGHKVKHQGAIYTHRSLPSGSLANPDAALIIGPGAVLNVDVLNEELQATGVDPSRVRIDPQVMIITPEDRQKEIALREKIRSTGQGVGAAAARRILGRGAETKLARDYPEISQYVSSTAELINSAFEQGQRVLVEGTQGTGLSLFHGEYPWVTSRDTTVAGTLAECGIGPRRVRRAVMVVRTYPIRVHGEESGPIGQGLEIDWAEIERRSGVSNAESAELSSVTKEQRRVAEFDWALLRRSAELNSATDVALTFADYISENNRNAYRYEQLTAETLQFVEEVESVSGAAVSLITTDFSERAIIDRRTWRAARR
ncbi:adenylosuccinate synthetase [Cellulosimicrobium cellulans]|uniref:adenylosuccinate synthetase n=1 Tax=Cellulosimicrobium cellulans TaxID=1710 RepID=UPI00214A1BC0|nr:adenylosuccinate synthetase [Cellulosimicrobium cellulans]